MEIGKSVNMQRKPPGDSTGENILQGMAEWGAGKRQESYLFSFRAINHSRTRAAKAPTITAATMEICASMFLLGRTQELCKEKGYLYARYSWKTQKGRKCRYSKGFLGLKFEMAGAGGFEPPNEGSKGPCLTA